jgi:hypothetical protein
MKKTSILFLILATALAMRLQAKSFPTTEAAPRIQMAILLDTSGSMDGLIDQARSRIWKIVNELAAAKKNGWAPLLQVALYEYGQSTISAAQGYLRRIVPLTYDLDRVSEELFKLKTNGGQEYCGQVIQKAVGDLQWSKQKDDLKLIFIAGNEPFTQGMVDYKNSCREAIKQGIIVNTVFCGDYQEGLQGEWKAGADLADGQYLAIDMDRTPPPVLAPQDSEIARLSQKMNQTYIAFGQAGAPGAARQTEQDKMASAVSGEVMAQRAVAKAAPQYDSSSWDLVDAKKKGAVKLEELKDAELPQEMKGMSPAQRIDYVASMQKKREELQKKIAILNNEREKFVKGKVKAGSGTTTLDEAIIRALRKQALEKNFNFDK